MSFDRFSCVCGRTLVCACACDCPTARNTAVLHKLRFGFNLKLPALWSCVCDGLPVCSCVCVRVRASVSRPDCPSHRNIVCCQAKHHSFNRL